MSRPLAASLTGLGIAGLLLTTVPLGATGSGPSAAQVEVQTHAMGGRGPASGKDQRAVDTVESNSVAGLSISLVGAGAAIFGLRRLAARARVVR